MAERRMFAKSIIDSDAFLDMPLSAQALYFHLSMRADDEGFVGNPKRIRSMIGASEDDLKLLIAKRFLLAFESGVVVIKHWYIHNYIQKDRCKPTTYIEERSLIGFDGKKAYTERLDTKCIQDVSNLDTQDRLGKVSLDESMNESKEKDISSVLPRGRARASYEDIMNNMCLEEEVRTSCWEFIKHCQLNNHTLTNQKLADILCYMDAHGYRPQSKAQAFHDAINGGYYDIKRDF